MVTVLVWILAFFLLRMLDDTGHDPRRVDFDAARGATGVVILLWAVLGFAALYG